MLIWTDNKTGQGFEVKIQEDELFYRKQGEGNDKWGKGHPPGWPDSTDHLIKGRFSEIRALPMVYQGC